MFLSKTASGVSRESGMPGGSGLWTNRCKCDSVFWSHTGRGQVIAAPEVGSQWRFQRLCNIFFVAITTNKEIQFDLLCFSEVLAVQKPARSREPCGKGRHRGRRGASAQLMSQRLLLLAHLSPPRPLPKFSHPYGNCPLPSPLLPSLLKLTSLALAVSCSLLS